MRLKNNFFYTIREDIKDEDSVSGNLLVRSGMIKKCSSGVYMYLPLGYKVLKNIEKIIREEMDNSGAQELIMPSLISEEYFTKSKSQCPCNGLQGPACYGLHDLSHLASYNHPPYLP